MSRFVPAVPGLAGWLIGVALAGLVALAVLVTHAPCASAGKREAKRHLIYRPTYAEALREARVRNVPVFVTRHKDECGRCERQRKKVLTNKSFVAWANEHLVILVAHNERLHDTVEVETEDGETREVCPLYPGMTCREHVGAAVDIDNGRGDGLVRVPFEQLCPNSWLVLPTDEVVRIPEDDQFDAGKVRKIAEDNQAKLGAALGRKSWLAVRPHLDAAVAAVDAGTVGAALRALAAVETKVAEPPASLRRLLERRLTEVDEEADILADDFLSADEVGSDERAAAKALLEALDVQVLGKHVPTRAKIRAWLTKQR